MKTAYIPRDLELTCDFTVSYSRSAFVIIPESEVAKVWPLPRDLGLQATVEAMRGAGLTVRIFTSPL
jgi:hypothetical protein